MAKRRSDIRKFINASRNIWRQSESYQKVKKLAKDPNRRGWFICGNCHQSREVIRIDHFEPIGKEPDSLDDTKLLAEWIYRLMNNSQWGLCQDCHKAKSKEERAKGAYK